MLSWTDDLSRCSIEWRFLSRNKLSINVIKFLLKSRPIFLNHLLWSELEINSLKIFLTSQKIEQLLIQNARAKFIPQLLNFPHPIGFTRSVHLSRFQTPINIPNQISGKREFIRSYHKPTDTRAKSLVDHDETKGRRNIEQKNVVEIMVTAKWFVGR